MYNLKKVESLIQIKKDTTPDTSSHIKSLNPTIPTLTKASSIPRPGANSKRHQLKASFFMSNLLSYFISQQLKIAKLPIKCN